MRVVAYRTFVQTLGNEELDLIWDEMVAWEESGSLPDHALLRKVTRDGFGHNPVPEADIGMSIIAVMDCGHEVWREIARRAKEPSENQAPLFRQYRDQIARLAGDIQTTMNLEEEVLRARFGNDIYHRLCGLKDEVLDFKPEFTEPQYEVLHDQLRTVLTDLLVYCFKVPRSEISDIQVTRFLTERSGRFGD